MDFLTTQKQFSHQNWAKVTQLCCTKPGLGSETAELPGCRLRWVILASQCSFFWLTKISADFQGRNLTLSFERSSVKHEQPGQSPKGQAKARLNHTAVWVRPPAREGQPAKDPTRPASSARTELHGMGYISTHPVSPPLPITYETTKRKK